MSSQYGELRPTSGWDLLASLGHPGKFRWVSRLSSVTARHSTSGRQPNFSALKRGRHLYSAGRPSRWALAHVLAVVIFCYIFNIKMSKNLCYIFVRECNVILASWTGFEPMSLWGNIQFDFESNALTGNIAWAVDMSYSPCPTVTARVFRWVDQFDSLHIPERSRKPSRQ